MLRPFVSAPLWMLLALVPASSGAQGNLEFHSYKPLRAGQYTVVRTRLRDGKPDGKPITSVSCVETPYTLGSLVAMARLGNVKPTQCSLHTVHDEPAMAEYEQVCGGEIPQQGHVRIENLNSSTQTVDYTLFLPSLKNTTVGMHLVARLIGACTAKQIRDLARKPGTPDPGFAPSAGNCGRLAEMRREADDLATSCAATGATNDAGCSERAKSARQMVEMEEQACKKP